MNYNIKDKTPVGHGAQSVLTPRPDGTDHTAGTPRITPIRPLSLKPIITPIAEGGSDELASAVLRINNDIAQINERHLRTAVTTPVSALDAARSTPTAAARSTTTAATRSIPEVVIPTAPAHEADVTTLDGATSSSDTPSPHVSNVKLAEKMNAIETALKFHMRVEKIIWEEIPIGATICYTDQSGEFYPARIVKRIFRKDSQEELYFGLQPEDGKKRKTEVVAFTSVDKIWKRYPIDATIEFLMIHNSLRMKNAQIAALEAKINELSAIIHARK